MSSNLMRRYLDVLNEEIDTINENMGEVSIIGYNSGADYPLSMAANDPKARRTVKVVKLTMGNDGSPKLEFKDSDGSVYQADWNPQYGWVADFN
jgi:hypothetical protein